MALSGHGASFRTQPRAAPAAPIGGGTHLLAPTARRRRARRRRPRARARQERLEHPRERRKPVDDGGGHDRRDGERRHRCAARRVLPHGRAEHEQRQRERRRDAAQPGALPLERVAGADEGGGRGAGDGQQHEIEGDAVGARRVGEQRTEPQATAEAAATRSWREVSPPVRTVLPARRTRALRYARSSRPERRTMADTTLTWLGHSAFRLDTARGKRIYVDPFLNGNPTCPESERDPERADVVAVTHGHGDHVGDTVAIAQKHGSTVVAIVELSSWLGAQGRRPGASSPARTRAARSTSDGVKFTLTVAFHSGLGAGRLLRRRAVGPRRRDRGRADALLRGRHVHVRRHGADRARVQARPRHPADRRPLHDGAARGGGRARAAAARSAACRATGARSRC